MSTGAIGAVSSDVANAGGKCAIEFRLIRLL